MTGSEFVVLNPRHRRRRRKSARRAATSHRRRRRRVARAHNPARRRRRSHVRRFRARRRLHRNPRILGGIGGVVGAAAGIAGGMIVLDIASDFLANKLPANLQTGTGALAFKAGLGIVVLPALVKMIPGGAKFARPIALGATAFVLWEAYQAYLAPQVTAMLNPGAKAVSGYGTRQISGYGTSLPEANGQVAGLYAGPGY